MQERASTTDSMSCKVSSGLRSRKRSRRTAGACLFELGRTTAGRCGAGRRCGSVVHMRCKRPDNGMPRALASHHIATPDHPVKRVNDSAVFTAVEGGPELLSQRQGGHAVRASPEQFEDLGGALIRHAPSMLRSRTRPIVLTVCLLTYSRLRKFAQPSGADAERF